MQLDLLARQTTPLTPRDGLPEPRLWVQKLTIWREPHEVIRTIGLRPGLNIIWSPDGGAPGTSMGHGGGKTTFCRLLRYCLGEDSFAPDGQRRSTWDKLPNGHVSAEVRLDGADWLVVRALGMRARDLALEGGTLTQAFDPETRATGMDAFRRAVETRILGDAVDLMPEDAGGGGRAWQAVLAWLTRDQECRFDKLLHWRDPDSNSGSPARTMTEARRLDVVRATLNALTRSELDARRKEQSHEALAVRDREAITRLEWVIGRATDDLKRDLATDAVDADGAIDLAVLKSIAEERLAKTRNLPVGRDGDLPLLRSQRRDARERLDRLMSEASSARVLAEQNRTAESNLKGEAAELGFQQSLVKQPICRLCKVPVDRVLAEGCSISLSPCDLDQLRAEMVGMQARLKAAASAISEAETRARRLDDQVATARRTFAELEAKVVALEAVLLTKTTAMRVAERLVEDVDRLGAMMRQRVDRRSAAEASDKLVAEARAVLAERRHDTAAIIARLSDRFDRTTRVLISENISADAKLDGKGLALKLVIGGERVTAALESLKIVAFDLAVLALTTEGHTRLPGFLVHDSPREADLGVSIYHRLFPLVVELEAIGPKPLFQYVVTTTTAPPAELQTRPWLCETLHGAPASERLFGLDL